MKPSERIKEIWAIENNTIKIAFPELPSVVSAIIDYLDEEYDKQHTIQLLEITSNPKAQ